jgi:glutathione synthase
MKLGFVVNNIQSEQSGYTTTLLAMAAVNLGHESWTMAVGDFVYAPDGSIQAFARSVSGKAYDSPEAFLGELQGERGRKERITVDDLDVLLLRNDPSTEGERTWAQTPGILFGQLAVTRGVIVLNDPKNLANALYKTYFQHFPEQVRPSTCISRNIDEIKQFIADQRGKVVIKPLQGSGGHNVFLIREDEQANLHQMIEAVLRDGYCIAQEYLPGAADGDVRMFVMNGRPLMNKGKYAAFRRVNRQGDMRSNMHTGGVSEPVEVTAAMLQLVEAIRPKLMQDGMFLVGLDVIEDKLMEINVFTPGGLGSASQFAGIDFSAVVIEALQRKVNYKTYYDARISNVEMATL